MARRCSAPQLQDDWRDAFDDSGSLEGHDSRGQQRRQAALGRRRISSPDVHTQNPFEVSFARNMKEAPVTKLPARKQAEPPVVLTERAKERQALWEQAAAFLTKMLVSVVEEMIAGAFSALSRWAVRGSVGAMGARVGAQAGCAAAAAAATPGA